MLDKHHQNDDLLTGSSDGGAGALHIHMKVYNEELISTQLCMHMVL